MVITIGSVGEQALIGVPLFGGGEVRILEHFFFFYTEREASKQQNILEFAIL